MSSIVITTLSIVYDYKYTISIRDFYSDPLNDHKEISSNETVYGLQNVTTKIN